MVLTVFVLTCVPLFLNSELAVVKPTFAGLAKLTWMPPDAAWKIVIFCAR